MKPYADKQWEAFNADRVPVEEWAGDLEKVARLKKIIWSRSESKSE